MDGFGGIGSHCNVCHKCYVKLLWMSIYTNCLPDLLFLNTQAPTTRTSKCNESSNTLRIETILHFTEAMNKFPRHYQAQIWVIHCCLLPVRKLSIFSPRKNMCNPAFEIELKAYSQIVYRGHSQKNSKFVFFTSFCSSSL